MSHSSLIKLIQVGSRELGIASDDRKAMQLRLVGKNSLADMDQGELKTVLEHLKSEGFTPRSKSRSKGHVKAAPRADLRFVHVLWGKLGEAGLLRDPSRKGLNGFIRTRFAAKWGAEILDIDQLSDWAQINDVIRALKDWCKREGVELETTGAAK